MRTFRKPLFALSPQVSFYQLIFYLRLFKRTLCRKVTLIENKISTSAKELIVKLLTVQIEESTSKFSTPLYLPLGKKSAGDQGTKTIELGPCKEKRTLQVN